MFGGGEGDVHAVGNGVGGTGFALAEVGVAGGFHDADDGVVVSGDFDGFAEGVVDGKEDMGIALERELDDDDTEEILKVEDGENAGKKRKAQDVFSELLDTDDLEIKKEIDELVHEEEDMLNLKTDEDEDEPDVVEDKGAASVDEKVAPGNSAGGAPTTAAKPEEMVIELSDDEETEEKSATIAQVRDFYRKNGIRSNLRIDPQVRFNNLRLHRVQYHGPSYGLIMIWCNGRVVVKSIESPQLGSGIPPKIGSIIVAVNARMIP